MYATVFKKGPLDPKLGKLYRDKILLVGGSRDEMDSLKVCRAIFALNLRIDDVFSFFLLAHRTFWDANRTRLRLSMRLCRMRHRRLICETR